MPPGASKKRKGVTDFKTVKRKLGHKYKSATHTDLSFQTRAIFMPTQSVSEDKDEYVNNRNLSLGDLLTQCRHYNETTRREAVNELKDFLLKFPIVLENHLSKVCDKLVELMLDSSGDVRMALYSLLDEILPILPETLVSPFFPLFVAYLSTGMTHVNAAVRLDALQYSNLWLYYHPGLVSKSHFKFLPHYLTLLATREPPPKMEKPEKIRRLQKKEKKTVHEAKLHIPNALKMKNVLLASLYDLAVSTLGHAEHYGTNDNVDLEMSKVARKHLHLGELDQDIAQATYPRSAAVVVPYQPSFTLANIVEANTHLSSLGTSKIESTAKQNTSSTPTEAMLHLDEPESFKYFFTTVYPLLISQWLECDPENLVPHALKPLESILKLFDLMLSHLDSLISGDAESQAAKVEFLEKYLTPTTKYIFSVFPFDYPPNWTDDELSIITHLNVLIAMVGSHFYNSEISSSSWAVSIVDYTLQAFSGTITRPTGRRAKQSNPDEEFVKRRPDPRLQAFEAEASSSSNKSHSAAESSSNSMEGQSDATPTQLSQKKKDKASAQDSMHFQIVGELLPVIRRLTSLAVTNAQDEDGETDPAVVKTQLMQRKRLLKAFQMFNDACPPKSHSKRMCIAFLSSLLLDDDSMEIEEDEQASSSMSVDDSDVQPEKDLELAPRTLVTSIPSDVASSLLLSLPKTLWQLQGEFPVTSQTILGILAHLGATPLRKAQLELLQPALIPFFWTSIAKKPKTKKAGSTKPDTMETNEEPKRKAVFGPFVKLPDHVQRVAIDVLANFATLSPAMVESVLHCCSSPKVGVETIGYLFETLENRFESVGDFVSFALSFLIAVASETLDNDSENCKYRLQRCFVVSRILARASAKLLLREVFLQLIEDHLLPLFESFLTDATSSTSDEFVLASTLCSFIGAYIKLSGLSTASPSSASENVVPAALTAMLPKVMLHIIKLSSSNGEKNAATTSFNPHLIMVKDILQSLPETFNALINLYASEIIAADASQAAPIMESVPTVVLDLISKYRTPATAELLKSSGELARIVAHLKETRSDDPIVRRTAAQLELLVSH